jgi:hypothetical protein
MVKSWHHFQVPLGYQSLALERGVIFKWTTILRLNISHTLSLLGGFTRQR